MLVRKQIELGRLAMLRSMITMGFESRQALIDRITTAWSNSDDGVVTLSVRTGFDLFLSERAYSKGSEILFSGASIPDMPRIAESHGLKIRAVDFDLCDLAPSVEAFANEVNQNTRAIVFAQLFGARVDLGPLAKLCVERRLDLLEDAAQAFDVDYRGHPAATVSMFSFGPIKSATALGGAVLNVTDPELRGALRRRALALPVASGFGFRKKLAHYFILRSLAKPWTLGCIARYLRHRGRTLDDLLAGSARSFPGADLLTSIREQPSRPLLRLLARRLSTVPEPELRARAAAGRHLAERLEDRVDVPAVDGIAHGYWVFPVLSNRPAQLVSELCVRSFDATRCATLSPVQPGLPKLERDFERIVYLPFAVEHSSADRDRLVAVIEEIRGLEHVAPTQQTEGLSG